MNTETLCPLSQRYTYHVLTAAACMPASNKFGVYKRVAVVEVDHHERPIGFVPERIADCRGVRVMQLHDRLNVGTTEACAYGRALAQADERAEQLRTTRAREAAIDSGEVVLLGAAA